MRLPTSNKPALLAHRSKPMPPRPRDLLTSTPVRPPSPDEAAASAPPPGAIAQPKPRAAISSLLSPSHHRAHSNSPAGRPAFPSARSTDAPHESYNGARREISPARSTVSQPPPASTAVAGDSDAR